MKKQRIPRILTTSAAILCGMTLLTGCTSDVGALLRSIPSDVEIEYGKRGLIVEIDKPGDDQRIVLAASDFDNLNGEQALELVLDRLNELPADTAAAPETEAPAETLISKEQAIAAALERAGLNSIDRCKCELDREHQTIVWEIEFKSGGCEYEVDVDAITGEILKFEKEYDD